MPRTSFTVSGPVSLIGLVPLNTVTPHNGSAPSAPSAEGSACGLVRPCGLHLAQAVALLTALPKGDGYVEEQVFAEIDATDKGAAAVCTEVEAAAMRA
mmetsp:Transcript_11106/g.29056  ORF Transcript_11106/g.29056 Transcript_11106/m.29056 type:complete len:98 (+) Transcript_11106:160-453(+)